VSRVVTLTTLQSRVKQRANVEFGSNNALFTTAELTDNINEGLARLYGFIIGVADQPYYLSNVAFNTSGNVDTYIIGPGQVINISDFFKGKGLDISYGQQLITSCRPFTWVERNRYKWIPGRVYNQPTFYQFIGKASGAVANAANDALKIIPMPSGSFACTLWYYPVLAPLVNPGDEFDGINGFEEYAVLDAAIKLLTKQERFDHAQMLMGEREQEKARILASIPTHDAENPQRVQDVMLNDNWLDWPGY
jgi:hypothetical protein